MKRLHRVIPYGKRTDRVVSYLQKKHPKHGYKRKKNVMNTDNSIAMFWHAYSLDEKVPKLLLEKTMPLTSGPMAEVVHTVECPDDTMPEVIEYP
jgi:hypothetical protein